MEVTQANQKIRFSFRRSAASGRIQPAPSAWLSPQYRVHPLQPDARHAYARAHKSSSAETSNLCARLESAPRPNNALKTFAALTGTAFRGPLA